MRSPNPALDAVVMVLYQPQDAVNVAAAVRAMSHFGLRRLRLVEPAAYDAYRIAGIAHHTAGILERVERYPTLADALADCGFVAATTGRPRRRCCSAVRTAACPTTPQPGCGPCCCGRFPAAPRRAC